MIDRECPHRCSHEPVNSLKPSSKRDVASRVYDKEFGAKQSRRAMTIAVYFVSFMIETNCLNDRKLSIFGLSHFLSQIFSEM